MANDRSRTGTAGTFYVAAQLAQRGWDAAPTLANAPRTDLVAQHGETQQLIAVQCKTSNSMSFILGKGCESPSAPGRNEWYVLTALGDIAERPSFYVIPRNLVAAYLFIGHRAWLAGTTRTGKPRNDSPMRNINAHEMEPFRERWDLLLESPDAVPHWLPDWAFDWLPTIGLPEGHPGLLRPAR